jgi:hypothetical protein
MSLIAQQGSSAAPDISLTFPDSQWLAEHIRMIYTMARHIDICFTKTNIYIFLCTPEESEIPFYSGAEILTSKLGFYHYNARGRDGELLPFVGLTFRSNAFYNIISSKTKHSPVEMYYYMKKRKFLVKHSVKNINDPDCIRYINPQKVESTILYLPFTPGKPDFQFNSENISNVFSSATQQRCNYVRFDIYDEGTRIKAFDLSNETVLYCEADFLPEDCEGTVTFSHRPEGDDKEALISLALADSVARVLGKINKITPAGSNVGVYPLIDRGVIFLEIDIGTLGKVYIGLTTSETHKNKLLPSIRYPNVLEWEEKDDDGVNRSRVRELRDSDGEVELSDTED